MVGKGSRGDNERDISRGTTTFSRLLGESGELKVNSYTDCGVVELDCWSYESIGSDRWQRFVPGHAATVVVGRIGPSWKSIFLKSRGRVVRLQVDRKEIASKVRGQRKKPNEERI